MMENFTYALISVIIVSLISFTGVLTLFFRRKLLEEFIMILVSLAAGALIGGAFLHLLPESVEKGGPVFIMVIWGIIVFFVIETFLYWYHCHAGHIHGHTHKCPVRPMGYLNLIGDGIHNFIDGMIIATAFMVNIQIGIITTIAVIFHEIPQEIGDFGVLIYSGFSRFKALLFNFLSALTAILGVILTYAFASMVENLTLYLIPFAAGGFIYIAMTDLMPELKQEKDIRKNLLQLIIFLTGILIMWILKLSFGH